MFIRQELNRLSARVPGARRWVVSVCRGLPVLAALGLAGGAAAAPNIYFDGEPYCTENVGDHFTASIWVGPGPDSLGCFQLFLTYDRTSLELLSASVGALFRDSGFQNFFIWSEQTADTTAFAGCLLGPGTFVVGPGELVHLAFRVRACVEPTEVALDLTERRNLPLPPRLAYLTDVRRQLIPGTIFTDGRARICFNCSQTSVGEGAAPPAALRLDLSPNPVWHTLRITWDLPFANEPAASPVLEIFAPGGRQVLARALDSSRGELAWAVAAPDAAPLSSGIYFARVRAGHVYLTKKFVHIE